MLHRPFSTYIADLKSSSFFIETLRHFKNYLGTRIATQALSFIAIPVWTRLLAPEDYGIYNVFLSYLGVFSVILTLNLYSSIGRYYYENKSDFDSFLGTVIALSTAQLAIGAIIFLSLRLSIAASLSLPLTVVLLLPLAIVIATIDNVYQQIYQALKESKAIAVITIWRTYLTFGTSVIVVLFLSDQRYLGLIAGQIVMGLAYSFYLVLQIRKHLRWSFERKHLRYIFSYSIPLIPYTLSGIILDQFDRIMINSYSGSASAGLYSFAYNIGMLLNVFSGALYQAWMPNYFEYMNKKDHAALDLNAERMFRIILLAAAFLIFFGQDLGVLLAQKSYHGSLPIVPIIVLGYVFYSIFPIYAWSMGYGYRTGWISFIVLFCGIVNIILNKLYIPIYGYVAAAYSTVFSFFLMALMAWSADRFLLRLYTTPPSLIIRPLGVLLSYFAVVIVLQMSPIGYLSLFIVKVLLMASITYVLLRKYLSRLPRNG